MVDWTSPRELLIAILTVVVVVLFVTPLVALVNLAFAWRQWREGGAGWLRLFLVCGFFAILQSVPLALMFIIFPQDEAGTTVPVPALILFAWNWLLLALALCRPVRLAHSREGLPLVEDPGFIARLNELSAAMSLRTPVVRLVRSLSGEQQAAAFAGGLPAPSLVVTDGILHRLQPDERDAVVGHELAHLANGSLWWLTCVTPACALAGLLTAGVAGGWFGFLFAMALRVGLLRVVSRHFERDCDRRAADVIGYRTMASALRKIHAAHVLQDSGWRSVLIYATATHPSLVERLSALQRAAPEVDQPDASSPQAAARRTLTARLAGMAWLLTMMVALAGGCMQPSERWPGVLLLLVLTVPFWPLVGAWRQLMRVRRRTRQVSWRKRIGMGMLGIAFIVFLGFNTIGHDAITSRTGLPVPLLLLFWMLVGLLLVLGGTSGKTRRLRQRVLQAMQKHDFAEAVRLGGESRRHVERDAQLGHNVAVARALSGDPDDGIAELRANQERHPWFLQSRLALTSLYLDAGDDEAALDTAELAAGRLKDDPEPKVQQAMALCRLGRLEAAEAAARQALALAPDAGEPHAALAGVLIDRGDDQGAREALDTAERLAPGAPLVSLVQAEWELRFGNLDDARRAVSRTREIARSNPFAVIDRQVDRLEAVLSTTVSAVDESHSRDELGPLS